MRRGTTKAMHLAQCGVSLDIARDNLVHVDIDAAEIYAERTLR